MPKKGNLDKRPIPEDSSRAVEYLQERLMAYTGKSRIIDRVLARLSRLLRSTQTARVQSRRSRHTRICNARVASGRPRDKSTACGQARANSVNSRVNACRSHWEDALTRTWDRGL